MGDGDDVTGGSTPPVTMDDLKSLETSLKSSMDTQMEELRSMMREQIGRASCRERVYVLV